MPETHESNQLKSDRPGGLQAELEARVSLTAPHDKVIGFIFNAVLDEVRARLGAPAAESIRGEARFRDVLSYSAADFLRLLFAAGTSLNPEHPDEGFRACGVACTRSFFQSAVGTALLAVIGKKNPRRLVSSVPAAYSMVVSYGERSYQLLGENQAKLIFHGDMQPPSFHRGALEEAIRSVGHEPEVTAVARGFNGAEYTLTWRVPAEPKRDG